FGGLVHGGHHSFVAYPGSTMYMPWLDFSGPEGGLAMINYMGRPYTGGVAGVNQMGYDKGSLECYGWAHYPLIGKAGTWTSPPVGVGIREGSWHTTADRYYDWFRSTIGIEIEQPASLRTGIGFQNIYTREFGAARINDFESIPEHARAGVDNVVRDLSVWDHASMGNYVLYEPDVDLLDYTPGDCEKLRRAIAEAREQGAVVSALVNFRHINVRPELYARYKSEAVLSLDGSEQRENWCGTRSSAAFWSRHLGLNCILLSPRSPATRKRVEMLLEKYLELGYTALFYDQPFLYQLDYNHMGAESRPDDASSAWYDIIQDARSRLREENADAYTIGEQCDIFSASRAIDLHMEWNFTNNGIEDLARVHYACPHALLSYVIDYTTTGEAHASHAFAAGLYLCLAIDGNESNIGARPALAEHVRRLAALRKKCADRTVFGRFRHTEGLMCDNDPGIVAYAYDSDHGPAVVLAAGDEGGTARVRLDASCFRSSASEGGGCLFLLNGDEKDVGRTDRLDCALSADQVVVWYL
ncbi:MAG: hypothetical protein K9N51_00005, partial [Candidatus Pacebacteria bacterium]|nr:hypothetical protein [Candidatus Paceibacterota bacterium]